MNLNEAISTIRVELQETNIKKSGHNKFAAFDYFELSDFLPTLNKLMNKYQVNDQMTIKDGYATLTLIKEEEKQEYSIPFVLFETPLNKQGLKSMQDIQYLGALNTYYKRYLYLNAFGITDGEVIDAMNNNDAPPQPQPATKTDKAFIKKTYGDKMPQLLEGLGLTDLEQLTYDQAKDIIKKLNEASQKKAMEDWDKGATKEELERGFY